MTRMSPTSKWDDTFWLRYTHGGGTSYLMLIMYVYWEQRT